MPSIHSIRVHNRTGTPVYFRTAVRNGVIELEVLRENQESMMLAPGVQAETRLSRAPLLDAAVSAMAKEEVGK